MRSTLAGLALPVALTISGTTALAAQGGIGFSYGRWWVDQPAYLASLAFQHRLLGPIDYGIAVYHLDDSRSLPDLTQTGGELSLGVGRVGSGLYGFAGAALGVRHQDGNTDAAWTVGGGYQIRLFSFLALGVDGSYRWEDTQVRGFWQLNPADRSGFVLQGRIAIGGGGRRRSTPPAGSGPQYVPPPVVEEPGTGGGGGATRPAAGGGLAADVVATALDAMGAPYRWGGSGENGYDCSGLIQWAYGEHGLVLPRTSRDQARMGLQVERSVSALAPGDVLGFSEGSGVSHVGLYVGNGDFIHSSSTGVRISSLTASDPDSRWWQQRWVTARRILH